MSKIKSIRQHRSVEEIDFDINCLNELKEIDSDYVKVILELFIKNTPEVLEKLQKACEDKDWDGLYRTAHFIKSSLAVIKVEKMYHLASELELNAKFDQEEKSAHKKVNLLIVLFEKLKTKILVEIEKLTVNNVQNISWA